MLNLEFASVILTFVKSHVNYFISNFLVFGIYSNIAEFDFPVRLVDGEWTEGEGRVEVEINGQWGTVCDDGWGKLDATIVCRKLGFPGATAAVRGAQFGPGTGPIFFSNVDCTVNDTTLAQCSHGGLNIAACTHEEDAGVVCLLGEDEFNQNLPICSLNCKPFSQERAPSP